MTADRLPLLLLLLGFVSAFLLTRLYTRLARARGWGSGSVGGVHLHHIVVGILLVLLSGLFAFALRPGGVPLDLLAIGFGVGAALILDEFALSVHLRDVYWTAAGRHSIEVSLMWVLLGSLLLVGISPFGIHDGTEGPRIVGFVVVALSIVLSVVTCLKGKLTLGLLSIFLPPVGLVAALRLARPSSVWASLFYGEKPEKWRKAHERFDPACSAAERLRHRLHDLIGGPHDLPTARVPTEQAGS